MNITRANYFVVLGVLFREDWIFKLSPAIKRVLEETRDVTGKAVRRFADRRSQTFRPGAPSCGLVITNMTSRRSRTDYISLSLCLGSFLFSAARGYARDDMAAPPSDRVQPAFLKNLLSHPGAQVEGNPHGNLTIFEFFDYRCLLCKAMQPELLALLAHDTRVRLVLKDWPLLGQDSVYAARVSIAAGWQGRYADVHDTLMAWRGPLGHEQTRALVKSAGVDMARLDRDMQDGGSKITMLLEKDAEEAHQLGIHATPGLVIGDEIVPGAVSAGDLNDIVQTTQAKL